MLFSETWRQDRTRIPSIRVPGSGADRRRSGPGSAPGRTPLGGLSSAAWRWRQPGRFSVCSAAATCSWGKSFTGRTVNGHRGSSVAIGADHGDASADVDRAKQGWAGRPWRRHWQGPGLARPGQLVTEPAAPCDGALPCGFQPAAWVAATGSSNSDPSLRTLPTRLSTCHRRRIPSGEAATARWGRRPPRRAMPASRRAPG